MTTSHSTPNPFAYVDASNLIKPDTRTAAERWLDKELERRGANEQGAEAGAILRQIALDAIGLLEPFPLAAISAAAKGRKAKK